MSFFIVISCVENLIFEKRGICADATKPTPMLKEEGKKGNWKYGNNIDAHFSKFQVNKQLG